MFSKLTLKFVPTLIVGKLISANKGASGNGKYEDIRKK